jgi:hypothetical protein
MVKSNRGGFMSRTLQYRYLLLILFLLSTTLDASSLFKFKGRVLALDEKVIEIGKVESDLLKNIMKMGSSISSIVVIGNYIYLYDYGRKEVVKSDLSLNPISTVKIPEGYRFEKTFFGDSHSLYFLDRGSSAIYQLKGGHFRKLLTIRTDREIVGWQLRESVVDIYLDDKVLTFDKDGYFISQASSDKPLVKYDKIGIFTLSLDLDKNLTISKGEERFREFSGIEDYLIDNKDIYILLENGEIIGEKWGK